MLVHTLILQTSEPGKLAAFYRDVLELPVNLQDERVAVTAGRSELVFEKAVTGNPFYHFAFNIPANKIEEARMWLSGKVKLLWMEGYKSDVADFVNWHAKSIYFFDPAGNIVELIARFDLPTATDETFSSKQFLSISEAGLVLPPGDFSQEAERIAAEYDLSCFDKQPPLPQFRVFGDDEGLFIMVPSQREWFPTNQPAAVFPIKVLFTEKNKKRVLDKS